MKKFQNWIVLATLVATLTGYSAQAQEYAQEQNDAYCDCTTASITSAAIPIAALIAAGVIIATTSNSHHHGSSSSHNHAGSHSSSSHSGSSSS